MTVSELRQLLDGQTRDAEVFIDGADFDGNAIYLRPLLVRPQAGGIAIVANEIDNSDVGR